MTTKLFLLVLTCVGLSSVSQLIMKMGMSAPSVQSHLAMGMRPALIFAILFNPWVIAGLSAYVVGAGMWLFVLSKAEVSMVYPFVGLGFVLTVFLGWLFLHEAVGFYRIVGTLFILVGTYFVAKS